MEKREDIIKSANTEIHSLKSTIDTLKIKNRKLEEKLEDSQNKAII